MIFDDCGLVELLLDEPSDVEVTFNSLCTRLHCRLKLFGSADLESRVTLEQAINERGMLDGAWESLYLETEDVNRSHQPLDQRESCRLLAISEVHGSRVLRKRSLKIRDFFMNIYFRIRISFKIK